MPDGAYFHDDATALADAGITQGCFDTQHFCPDQTVTRGQMAPFLARAAGLGGHPPVANALTAVTAQSAASANALQGYAASGLARVAGQSTSFPSTGMSMRSPT